MEQKKLEVRLYTDFSFPLNLQLKPAVVWKRPQELCTFPQFIVDGATRMDVCQGILNDCWFLSALASVAMNPPLLKQVVPMDQSFQQRYTGSFSFRFWQYGQWVEVKVDDRLPTQEGQLICLRSNQINEFWSPLLEKAYAKLKGGYPALNLGFPHEALVDMTGGVTEVLMVQALPQALGLFLRPLLARGTLINCANTQGPLEKKNELGILFKHAYTVTGLEPVHTKYGTVELVRVRNPWGKVEWEGPWSDSKGVEWSSVSKEEQQRLDRVAVEDGEFWMSVSDFRQNFDMMEVCHLSDETLSGGRTHKPWTCTSYHGRWDSPTNVPQYHLTLLEEDDDPTDPELTCSFLLALMQKHTRQRGVLLPTQINVYKARSESGLLTPLDVSVLQPVLKSGLQQQREVVLRGRLAPGNYVIVPVTSEKRYTAEFLLRILTEKGNTAVPTQKLVSDNSIPEQVKTMVSVLPSTSQTQKLFKKHCKGGQCRPQQLYNLLTEAISGGVFAGSVEKLCLEHCRSFVVLMDSRGQGQLEWAEFQALWDKFRTWTEIFMKFDTNQTRSLDFVELSPALTAAGLQVDEFVLQLIGLRYTEPDLTVSYPGFLYLLLKLHTMNLFAGSVEKLCLEHCRSFVVLMDSRGQGQLEWAEFQALWDKFRTWTEIFMKFDTNQTRSLDFVELSPALTAAGLQVDEFVLQLIGLRYTEPDLTVSYPGFLYLLLKLHTMNRKFQLFDAVGMGTVSLNYRQWLHITMYN